MRGWNHSCVRHALSHSILNQHRKNNMIGFSISFCIRDIADGKVALEDVSLIIGGTCVERPEDWDEVICRYRPVYWRSHPDECERIFRQLLAEGKIRQPRVLGCDAPNIPDGGVWAKTAEDALDMLFPANRVW